MFLKSLNISEIANKSDAFLLKFWGLNGANVSHFQFRFFSPQRRILCKSCRSRQELSNDYQVTINWQTSVSIQLRTSLSKFGGDSIHVFIRLLRCDAPDWTRGRTAPSGRRDSTKGTKSWCSGDTTSSRWTITRKWVIDERGRLQRFEKLKAEAVLQRSSSRVFGDWRSWKRKQRSGSPRWRIILWARCLSDQRVSTACARRTSSVQRSNLDIEMIVT